MQKRHFTTAICCLALLAFTAEPGSARNLDREAVDSADPSSKGARSEPLMVKLQLLLDRAGFSPGLIDGRPGSNLERATAAYEAEHHLKPDGKLDDALWRMLTKEDSGPVLEDYTIIDDDVRGPFVKHIPEKLEQIMMRALEVNPANRYKTAKEFLQDLEHYMYDGGYGPTNEKLSRYLARLFPEESSVPIVAEHSGAAPLSNSGAAPVV